MENLDNKWILNATSINQDCREKDGNNPVTLGLENMRGVGQMKPFVLLFLQLQSLSIFRDIPSP